MHTHSLLRKTLKHVFMRLGSGKTWLVGMKWALRAHRSKRERTGAGDSDFGLAMQKQIHKILKPDFGVGTSLRFVLSNQCMFFGWGCSLSSKFSTDRRRNVSHTFLLLLIFKIVLTDATPFVAKPVPWKKLALTESWIKSPNDRGIIHSFRALIYL